MMRCLERFNIQSNQNFKMRIGISVGPVIAGVVGAVKPQYDIWGDTVNVASRMDSYGVTGKIHITEEVARILIDLNLFDIHCRGIVEIKGKGELVTYLINCEDETDVIEEAFIKRSI
jgi:class 3 adenylate cyclase